MAGEVAESNRKKNWIEDTRAYLGDIRSEMKRVTWPSKDRVQSTTLVVIVSVFIFAAYFKVVDYVVQHSVVSLQQRLIK